MQPGGHQLARGNKISKTGVQDERGRGPDERRNFFIHRCQSRSVVTGVLSRSNGRYSHTKKRGVQESLPHLIPNTFFVITEISKS